MLSNSRTDAMCSRKWCNLRCEPMVGVLESGATWWCVPMVGFLESGATWWSMPMVGFLSRGYFLMKYFGHFYDSY